MQNYNFRAAILVAAAFFIGANAGMLMTARTIVDWVLIGSIIGAAIVFIIILLFSRVFAEKGWLSHSKNE